ncbi:hypothetical protein HAX54_051138 [Datura stramonium]|uniref:Miraculin-like n=1 Tax=Datura stramonium TaxID=4076 RepID=A0ABS8WPW3_DATST|nr:hypothetical protein [Datura stramonium]
MKRVNVLLISLVYLLLAFSSSCTTAQVVVRDVDGDILRSDARYFVVSPLQSAGGIRRGQDGAGDANFMCPSQVVQVMQKMGDIQKDKGISVYFKPKAAEQVEITESTSLNIEFSDGNVCNNTVWEVEGYPGTYENPALLSTNGVTGNPSTWFQIKKFNAGGLDAYMLVFCLNDEETCTEVLINYFHGQNHLAVKLGYKLPVLFFKDNGYGINSII